MNGHFMESIVTILVAVLGVATLAVIVSPNAQTSSVLKSGGNAFSNILGTALSPVSGNGYHMPLSN
jgi:hypothetical protein